MEVKIKILENGGGQKYQYVIKKWACKKSQL